MKVNFADAHMNNRFLELLILNGLMNALSEEEFHAYAEKRQKSDDKFMDVILTIDGIEVDLEKFIERWQENVRSMVSEKAQELVDEKFNDVSDTLSDLQDRIGEEVKKRLEEWEKDDRSDI
jgi:cation transport regulator ChaB